MLSKIRFEQRACGSFPNLDVPISKAANTQISAYLTIYPEAGAGVPAADVRVHAATAS